MSTTTDTSQNPFAPAEETTGEARRVRRSRKAKDDSSAKAGPLWAILAWVLTLLFFAPVAWMVLTSLHAESDAATNPPSVFAPLTFSNYADVFSRGISSFLINSATASIVSTLVVLLLAVPAAYALSIKPVEKWTDVMFFFLSTKFLPPIAALLPIYLIVKQAGMLDNVYTLVVLYTSMNLPIAIWMMQSFLDDQVSGPAEQAHAHRAPDLSWGRGRGVTSRHRARARGPACPGRRTRRSAPAARRAWPPRTAWQGTGPGWR